MAIEERLQAMMLEGQQRWPEVRLAPAAFVEAIAARLESESDAYAQLGKVRGGDLYLVTACLQRDGAALAVLDRLCQEICGAVSRRAGSRAAALGKDLHNALLARLLVPEPEKTPRLASFRGRGELEAFLNVCALRLATNLTEKPARGGAPFEQVLADLVLASDAEAQYLRRHDRGRFVAALSGGLAALSARERNLLRLQLDGVQFREIAALYGVHHVSVSRWFEALRRKLALAVRRELARTLGLSESEIESFVEAMLRTVSSGLEDALHQILDGGITPGPGPATSPQGPQQRPTR